MKSKIIIIIISIIVIFIIVIPLLIHIQNDIIANNTEKELLKTKWPNNTEIVDSLSIVGKLTGNGNCIQYFGAILVKTDLSKDDLEKYYKEYRNNEYSFLVSKQNTNKIEMIEHGSYKFEKYNENVVEISKLPLNYSANSAIKDGCFTLKNNKIVLGTEKIS